MDTKNGRKASKEKADCASSLGIASGKISPMWPFEEFITKEQDGMYPEIDLFESMVKMEMDSDRGVQANE